MQVTTGQRAVRAHLLFRVCCALGAAMALATAGLAWAYRGIEARDARERHVEVHQRLARLLAGAPGSAGALARAPGASTMSHEMSLALFGQPGSRAEVFCPAGSARPVAEVGPPAGDPAKSVASDWAFQSASGPCELRLRTDLAEDFARIDGRTRSLALGGLVLEGAALALLLWIARKSDARLLEAEREQQAMESELFFLTHYDTLTQLPNRSFFWERVDGALERGLRFGKAVGLVIVDLRDFSALNEAEGRAVGDRVLVESARRIQAAARSSDLVCRLGPDEFAVVLEGLDPERAADAAARLAASLGRQFAEPWGDICPRGPEINCAASLFPHDGQSSEDLLASAQQAVKAAKDANLAFLFHGESLPGRRAG